MDLPCDRDDLRAVYSLATPRGVAMNCAGCLLFENFDLPRCPLVEDTDSCPHAPALKAVVENPELVLVAVPNSVEFLQGWTHEHSGPVWLWVKEESLWAKYIGEPR
jgi:hypothetical protein